MEDRETVLLRSVAETTWRFYAWVGFLATVVLWGLYAYLQQLRYGLIVTGLRDQVSWGIYVTNFVFFIGISHAGTLISAILRVVNAGWRQPITRLAEGITVFALCIGAPMVIIDLGRPDRILNLFRYGRIQSPILWDVLSVTTYLTGCILYFYIPMIPDLGKLASEPRLSGWRRRLYKTLSLGWTGSAEQHQLLERAISVMAIIIIPLAVSVHTVVSWIFAMTLRPGWNTSLLGPYFVAGAIYSGIGMVILCMYFIRRVYHLEGYFEPLHFRNLGILLLTFSLIFLYFNINEYLTVGYKAPGLEKGLLDSLFVGEFAPYFRGMLFLTILAPSLLLSAGLAFERWRPLVVPGAVFASSLVVVGAWLERYVIVVPTLSTPLLPMQGLPPEWMHYQPTWVEWSITAAAFAGFLLIYTLLSKLFPIVSIWETREAEPLKAAAPSQAQPIRDQWGHVYSGGVILLVGLTLGAARPAQASANVLEKQPRQTRLVLEWEPLERAEVPPAENATEPAKPYRVYLFLDQLLARLPFGEQQSKPPEELPHPLAVTAILQDADGTPLAFRPVEFSFQTLFGWLSLGRRPTNAEGKAKLVISDRRYGNGPIRVSYGGDEATGPTAAEILVDFGPRPAPSLPAEGVLITPYATPAIALPFVLFYGFMWVMFLYTFGYLILWRLRRATASGAAPLSPEMLPLQKRSL